MASHLSSFFLLFGTVFLLSSLAQAREGKFFSFSYLTTTSHKLKSDPLSPTPSSESIAATPESIIAAQALDSTEEAAPVHSPTESSEFVNIDGYGLDGTTSFLKVLYVTKSFVSNNNDKHHEQSFKTSYGIKLYGNYNNNNEQSVKRRDGTMLYANYNKKNEEEYNNYNDNRESYNNNHRSNSFYKDSYNNNNNTLVLYVIVFVYVPLLVIMFLRVLV